MNEVEVFAGDILDNDNIMLNDIEYKVIGTLNTKTKSNIAGLKLYLMNVDGENKVYYTENFRSKITKLIS